MSTCSEGQSEKECPLCMEILELDDINFFPCKCEYQICRFCWHRIRTDENGLCPACRQPYPEDPVNFKPLTSVDVQRHKNEKRMKKQAEKIKISETRQHLASYRVLQKNLVYVVGLSSRVADPEILKKPEYFGRYGKILKIVTSIAPSLPHQHLPQSHTAYVTYKKVEEALRAIIGVHNSVLDGRLVKASLGTTKYCSSFLQIRKCFKQECMYLHENAEPEISFTKEDMHAGKHTEYEKKLIESIVNRPPPPQVTVASIIEKSISLRAKPLSQHNVPANWEAYDDEDFERDDTDDNPSEVSSAALAETPLETSEGLEHTKNFGDEDNASSNDSIEDPAPSNQNDGLSHNKKNNTSARDRKWSEREENSLAQSHSPPTDPEANEFDNDESVVRLDEMMAQLGTSDGISRTCQENYSCFGIPAPADHKEAPAPLMQWDALLGLSPQQPDQPPIINTESLFSSFTSAFSRPLQQSQPYTVPSVNMQNTAPRQTAIPSPPPGLKRYDSEDDLGFDPFIESSKGLSALLQEEEQEELVSTRSNTNHNTQSYSQNQSIALQQLLMQQHQLHQLQQIHQQSQHHQQLQQPSLPNQSFLHQLHAQQQAQNQQQPVNFGQSTGSLSSLWSNPSHSLYSGNLGLHQQLYQHQNPLQSSSSHSNMTTDSYGQMHLLRQQQMMIHQQQQQQQQQQQASASALNQNSLMNEFAAARQAASSSLFSPLQQFPIGQQQELPSRNNSFSVAPPPGLSGSTNRQMSQNSNSQSGMHQMMNSMTNQQLQPQLSMQESFKALLPNVNVRFMDDSSMSRWSHENSLRSGANVQPPPGFSSILNR